MEWNWIAGVEEMHSDRHDDAGRLVVNVRLVELHGGQTLKFTACAVFVVSMPLLAESLLLQVLHV